MLQALIGLGGSHRAAETERPPVGSRLTFFPDTRGPPSVLRHVPPSQIRQIPRPSHRGRAVRGLTGSPRSLRGEVCDNDPSSSAVRPGRDCRLYVRPCPATDVLSDPIRRIGVRDCSAIDWRSSQLPSALVSCRRTQHRENHLETQVRAHSSWLARLPRINAVGRFVAPVCVLACRCYARSLAAGRAHAACELE